MRAVSKVSAVARRGSVRFPKRAAWLEGFKTILFRSLSDYRRRITPAYSQDIARYIKDEKIARMVIPVITMFILKICLPYWMR